MTKEKKPAAKKYQGKADSDQEGRLITVIEATEDTTVETLWGPALVTEGNYIVTTADGSQHGMTPADLELKYEAVKSSAETTKKKA